MTLRRRRLRLVNPNSDPMVTRAMAAIAAEGAPRGTSIEATTSSRAAPLITTAKALLDAERCLIELFVAGLEPLDGVIVAAFGDPGVATLRRMLAVPIIGIAEAALREAADIGPFAVCTTTPALAGTIRERTAALGLANALLAVRTTDGDPIAVMANAQRLDAALTQAIERCIDDDGARAVVIGGGPLAAAARRLAPAARVPIVEPVSAAVRWFG